VQRGASGSDEAAGAFSLVLSAMCARGVIVGLSCRPRSQFSSTRALLHRERIGAIALGVLHNATHGVKVARTPPIGVSIKMQRVVTHSSIINPDDGAVKVCRNMEGRAVPVDVSPSHLSRRGRGYGALQT
jgi:hypothetical protein